MSDLVCVVAGGEWQAPIIRKLQDKGHKVLCINLYGHTTGARIADVFEQADVLDKEKCLEIARRYNVKAVLTDQSDISVPTVAYIAEQLGLKGIGIDKAELFTNKYLMRQRAEALGILCPKFRTISSLVEAASFAEEIGYPVIIKPAASQGSRGITIVRDASQLEAGFELGMRSSRNNQAILIEQFVDGVEWTAEGFQNNGHHTTLCLSQKKHFASAPTVSESINYEPLTDNDLHQQLRNINNRLVEGFELPFGITHAEYKLYDGQFYLIEIAARGGGSHISSHMVPFMSGVDVGDKLIDVVLGKSVSIEAAHGRHHYASLVFLNFAPGTVTSRTEEEAVEALPYVLSFKYGFTLGERLPNMCDDQSRHAQVAVTGETREQLAANIEAVKQLIQVTYE